MAGEILLSATATSNKHRVFYTIQIIIIYVSTHACCIDASELTQFIQPPKRNLTNDAGLTIVSIQGLSSLGSSEEF